MYCYKIAMLELIKTIIINLMSRLTQTELFVFSIIAVILFSIFGTIIFAISRGVTDICGKKFLSYKNNS